MPSYLFKKSNRIVISWMLIVAMLVNLYPTELASAEAKHALMEEQLSSLTGFHDLEGHWAAKEIIEWSGQGLVHGYQDGTFRPNATITRAEFAAMVNGLFKLTPEGSASFPDVQDKDWYASEVGAAVKAGYMQGDQNGMFRPQQPLNRSEAAVVVSRLVPVLAMEGNDLLGGFTDQAAIPSYGKAAMLAAMDAGYFTGFPDQTIRPMTAITRAEAVVLLNRILKQSTAGAGQALSIAPKVLEAAGTYGPASGAATVAGSLTLNAPGIILRNVVVQGDLLIGEPVGEGDIDLQGVKVLGQTIVKGGGENSIHLDNTELSTIIVEKENGRVRIVVNGTTIIEQMDIRSDAAIESNGSKGIEGITISSTGEVTLSGLFKNVVVNANVQLTVASGTIGNLQVSDKVTASTILLNNGVRVTQMDLHGGSSITGEGTIDKALVDAKDVSFANPPLNVETTERGHAAAPVIPPVITIPAPGTGNPGTTPGTENPGTPPGTENPGTTPGTENPGTTPGTDNPGTTPETENPGTTPGTDNPGTTPGTDNPGTTPGTENPGTTPGTENPGTDTPPQEIKVPGAPTELHAVAGKGQATVSFAPPADNGGSAITSYTVISEPEGKTQTGAGSPLTVAGLTEGVAYTFTVTAANAAGTSTASLASEAVIPSKADKVMTPVIANITAAGFNLSLDNEMEGIDSLSFLLKDSQDSSVTIDMVTSEAGSIYRIWAQLREGETYTLSLIEEGYSFPSLVQVSVPTIEKTVIPVTVDWVAHYGFHLTFAEPVNPVFTSQIVLLNGQGERIVIPAVTETAAARSYFVKAELSGGQSYTFQIQMANNKTASGLFNVPDTIPVAAQIDHPSESGFTFQLSVPVPDLTANEVVLTDDQGNAIPIEAITSVNQGGSYRLSAALLIGQKVTITITKAGYDIPAAAVQIPKTVQTTVALWGTTGVYAGFNPQVDGIEASNFKITNAAGENVPITSFEWYAAQRFYIIGFAKTGLQNYTVTITKPGYDFGEPKIIGSDTRFNYIENPTTTGFRLTLSPSVEYADDDFVLTDLAGNPVPITSVSKNHAGESYDFTAALVSGGYRLAIRSEPNTELPVIWVPIQTQLQVDQLTKSTFTVHFSPAVNGAMYYNFSIVDRNGNIQYPESAQTVDNGNSYQVVMGGAGLTVGTYTLKANGILADGASFESGEGTEMVIPDMTDARGSTISDILPTGFTITFTQPVPGLAASNMKITDSSDTILSDATLLTTDNGLTYRASVALEKGKDYKVRFEKSFYLFDAYNALHVNEDATANVQNVTSNGFRLYINPVIRGLTAAHVTIMDEQGTERFEALTTADEGLSYTADFGNLNLLGWGKTYTVSIQKAGYTFAPITVTTPLIVKVVNKSATQLVMQFEPPIPGLTAANFKLVDEAGAVVAISGAETLDGGAHYTVKAAMPSGKNYWVTYLPSVNYQLYSPIRIAVTRTITATVTEPSLYGFTLHLSEPVPGLRSKDLAIRSSGGTQVILFALTTEDQGLTYKIAYSVPFPDTYTVDLSSDAYGTFQEKFSLEAPVSFKIPIPGVVRFISINNETIGFSINHDLDLTEENIELKNSAGEKVAFSLNKISPSMYGLVSSVSTPMTYFMSVTYPGYDFGPAITIARDIQVQTFLFNQTQKGFDLRFMPAIPDLENANIVIKDENDNRIPAASVTTADFGKNYRISAPLTSGKTYKVTLEKTNYSLQNVNEFSLTANGAIINNISKQGFTLNVIKKLQFGAVVVQVMNPAGEKQRIQSIYSPDGGLSYEVGVSLQPGMDYTVQVENLGIAAPSMGMDYGEDKTIQLRSATASFEGMANNTGNQVVIRFDPALPDLNENIFHLLTPSGEIPILDAATEDGGLTYILTSTFRAGNTYTLMLRKDGYDFGEKLRLNVPFGIMQSVVNIGARTVDIALNPAVSELTADNFVLKDHAGNRLPASSVLTNDDGATYTVVADFTGGQPYSVGLVKTGYDFGKDSSAFIPSEIVPAVAASGLSGVTVSFSPAIAGLSANHFSLLQGAVSTPIASISTTDGGATYTVEADLIGGNTYELGVALDGYVFAPTKSSFHVAIPVHASAAHFTRSGLTLQLDPAVPGLTTADLTLRDDQGQTVAISSIHAEENGARMVVDAALTEGKAYSLMLGKTGYQFGAGVPFLVPVPVMKSIDYISEQGLTLHLGTAVSGLVPGDITLQDSSGIQLPVASLTTTDNGKTYRAAAALQPDSTYTVAVMKSGYDFGAPLTADVHPTITFRVSDVEGSSFTLHFSHAVPGFYSGYLKIRDDQGHTYTFEEPNTVYDLSGAQKKGLSFKVSLGLQTAAVYTIEILDPAHPFSGPIEMMKPYVVSPQITSPVKNSFMLSLGDSEVDLTAADISILTEAGDKLEELSLVKDEGVAGTYRVQAALTEGSRYTVRLSKKGYDFGSDISILVPIAIQVAVSKQDTNGFTISLEPGVENLTISLKRNGQAVGIQSATTTDHGYTYEVKTDLGANTIHDLVLSKAGYTFGAPLTVSNAATLPVLVNAVTNENGNKIFLNFDKEISSLSSSSLFSVKSNDSWLWGISAKLNADQPTQIIISMEPYTLLGPNDIVSVTFGGKNTVKAVNGTYLAAFSGMPVWMGSTALGYAKTQAQYDGTEPARRLRDDYKLKELEAAKVMREAGFKVPNYGRSIQSVYRLNSLQMAKLFYDMEADGLTALAGQNTLITPEILKNLVSVGYDAAIFVGAFKSLNYQTGQITSALKNAGVTNEAIAGILYNTLLEPAGKAAAALRPLGVPSAEIAGLLKRVYGVSGAEMVTALSAAKITVGDAAAALQGQYGLSAIQASKLLFGSSYALKDMGPAIVNQFGLSDADTLVKTFRSAGFSVTDSYIAAGNVYSYQSVAVALLQQSVSFAELSQAIKSSSDPSGLIIISYAFKQTGLGISELETALQMNDYSPADAIAGLMHAGFGLKESASVLYRVYGLDLGSAHRQLAEKFKYSYVSANAAETIFSAMVKAGYDPAQLAGYYLTHVTNGDPLLVIREMKTAGIKTDQALRIVHDIAQAAGNPLSLDRAFELFQGGAGYFTSDEVLSAVLYAFAEDSTVTLDVQSVGLAFFKVRLWTWPTGFHERAVQLKQRMSMTMQQWMELEKSDSRVSGNGVNSEPWMILRDTMMLYSSSTVTIQDAVNAMSASSKFTLNEVIDGINGYLDSGNVKGIMGLLKNTRYPMQTILTTIESNPKYGNSWIDQFRRYGLTASDVAVYYAGKGMTQSDIISKLSPYSMNEIVVVLRSDMGLSSSEALSLLSPHYSNVKEISEAIGYIYREAELDIAVKLLRLEGYDGAQVINYLEAHGLRDINTIPKYLVIAGYTKEEVTQALLQRYYGVLEMPAAVSALKSLYGLEQVRIGDLLKGASITTPEEALEFLLTHQYKLRDYVDALKTVYGKTAGETTTILNKRLAPGIFSLNEIMAAVALVYSTSEEAAILDVLRANGISTAGAAIVTLRNSGYSLPVMVKMLKNGYGLDAAQATDYLLKDGGYSAAKISIAMNAVYHANDELGVTAKLLLDAGISDPRAAVVYLADRYAGMTLTARVLNEVFHEDIMAAVDYMSVIPRYKKPDILIAVQEAYGTDPLFGYLGRMKLQGADAYQIANELGRQNRLNDANFLLKTLLNLGYDKDSSMDQVMRNFKRPSAAEIGQLILEAGFTEPVSIAKLLLRNGHNPNDGYSAAAIEIAVLPKATLGSLALGMKSAGFTSEAVIKGFLGNRFDDTLAAELKGLGFSALQAAEILNSARYSTEGKIIWLKKLGYPLSEFFGNVGGGYGAMVPILKQQGYSAVEIAQGLYRANVDAFFLIRYLDEGGFNDLATLVTAYYQSGEPMAWVIHDIYLYGKKGTSYRWPLLDVVNQLLLSTPISLSTLTGLINYANTNNYKETFQLIKKLSTREQDELLSSLNGAEKLVIKDHVANIVALTTMRSAGQDAKQGVALLKHAGGVSDWMDAILVMFFAGYSTGDILSAVFDEYRTEIGIQVLIALFNSGASQLIADYDKYYKFAKLVVKIVNYGVSK